MTGSLTVTLQMLWKPYILERKTVQCSISTETLWMDKNGVEAMEPFGMRSDVLDLHTHGKVGVLDVSCLHTTVENLGDLFAFLLIISSVWGSGTVGG